MYVELVTQLKSALATQQQASDRREQTEHKLRLQLERELRAERARNNGNDNSSGKYPSSNYWDINISCTTDSFFFY